MTRIQRMLWAFFDRTHPYRIMFWLVMIPVAMVMGWHTSVFLIFLYSTYANIASDVGAWEAAEARRVSED